MINSYAPKCLQTNNSFNHPWRNRYNLNTPLRRHNRSLSTLVSDCRSSAPKTTTTPGLFTYPPIYTSSAVNQYVMTRQQAADPARRTRLFPMSYQNNKHVIRLARSKPLYTDIQIYTDSRSFEIPLPQSNTVRILNIIGTIFLFVQTKSFICTIQACTD